MNAKLTYIKCRLYSLYDRTFNKLLRKLRPDFINFSIARDGIIFVNFYFTYIKGLKHKLSRGALHSRQRLWTWNNLKNEWPKSGFKIMYKLRTADEVRILKNVWPKSLKQKRTWNTWHLTYYSQSKIIKIPKLRTLKFQIETPTTWRIEMTSKNKHFIKENLHLHYRQIRFYHLTFLLKDFKPNLLLKHN